MRPITRVIEEIVSQLPGYEPRPQQVRMAQIVAEAIRSGRHAVIEAGTGSGKSFGYLIPALESGRKVVVSTGTIALQEQLLRKDVPFLAQAYGEPIPVALAKGRSNYVCLHKLAEVQRSLPPDDPMGRVCTDLLRLAVSGEWNGDRSDLPFNVEPRFWTERIASDPEDCLGPRCPNFAFTPHRKAREQCDDARIVIANHALYLTDLIRESGVLPRHDVVIFDEAHHLERAAVSAFSLQLADGLTVKLLQRVQRRFRSLPPSLVERLASADTDVTTYLCQRGPGVFRFEPEAEFRRLARALSDALVRLAAWLVSADAGQMLLLERDATAARQQAEILREQMEAVARDLAARWDHFAALQPSDARANWLQVSGAGFALVSAPLEIGDMLRHLLWSRRTCILTSATLAVDGGFDFVRRELGLPDNTLAAVLGSPFDFQRQALLYIPRHLPAPGDPRFIDAICPEIERILDVTRGRAFVLCTSYRSMREIAARLRERIPYPCRTQEDLPRVRLLDWFRGTPNAVLIATATFWEGVDIPGEALSAVIIEKLPFASPEDPVVQARTERMKARGEDWFGGFVLPKAVLSLKQGFGRLIRTRADTGLIAILDRRVRTMRYGEVILRSLPPARRIETLPKRLEDSFGPGAPLPDRSFPECPPRGGFWNPPPPDLDAVLSDPPD